MKFGKGYQWKGDLVLFHEARKGFTANGILSGREFEAFGYCFRHLEGTLEASSQHMLLSNLNMDDIAGEISIKKIELNRSNTRVEPRCTT